MDTDSLYFALSHDTLEEAVIPERLKSLNGKRKIGCLGTSGAAANPGCSSSSLKALAPLPFAASAISSKTKTAGQSKSIFQGHVQNPEQADMAAL